MSYEPASCEPDSPARTPGPEAWHHAAIEDPAAGRVKSPRSQCGGVGPGLGVEVPAWSDQVRFLLMWPDGDCFVRHSHWTLLLCQNQQTIALC